MNLVYQSSPATKLKKPPLKLKNNYDTPIKVKKITNPGNIGSFAFSSSQRQLGDGYRSQPRLIQDTRHLSRGQKNRQHIRNLTEGKEPIKIIKSTSASILAKFGLSIDSSPKRPPQNHRRLVSK